jgi:hypothetical protein
MLGLFFMHVGVSGVLFFCQFALKRFFSKTIGTSATASCPWQYSARSGAISPLKTLWAMKGTLGWVCFRRWGCLGRRIDDRSRNRERGRAQALGGRRFFNSYNNQPKDSIRGKGDIRDGMQPWRNVSGGGVSALFGVANRLKKKLKNEIRRGLRRPPNDK